MSGLPIFFWGQLPRYRYPILVPHFSQYDDLRSFHDFVIDEYDPSCSWEGKCSTRK